MMNVLPSPGLSADSGDQHKALQRLYSPEQGHNIDSMSPHLSHPPATNNFITGPWHRKQIERSKLGTAVNRVAVGLGQQGDVDTFHEGLGTHGRPGPNMGTTHCHWIPSSTLQRPFSRGELMNSGLRPISHLVCGIFNFQLISHCPLTMQTGSSDN